MKNKGKYEIGFSFVFESTEKCENPGDLFTITPNKGTLIPSDRPTQVQIIFRSKDEVTIKDEPILKCQVMNALFNFCETVVMLYQWYSNISHKLRRESSSYSIMH